MNNDAFSLGGRLVLKLHSNLIALEIVIVK